MAGSNGEKKAVDDGIANSHDQEQILKGIQPKHQIAYKIFKFTRIYFILMLFFICLSFCFLATFSIFYQKTDKCLYH